MTDYDYDYVWVVIGSGFGGSVSALRLAEKGYKVHLLDPVAKHDEIFDCDVKVFKKKGQFRQRVKVLGSPVTMSGSIEGQVCTELDGKCISFAEDFSFDNIIAGATSVPKKEPVVTPPVLPKTADTKPDDQKQVAIPQDTAKTSVVTKRRPHGTRRAKVRGAHASRVRCSASRRTLCGRAAASEARARRPSQPPGRGRSPDHLEANAR